jgi:hypothetical protein
MKPAVSLLDDGHYMTIRVTHQKAFAESYL